MKSSKLYGIICLLFLGLFLSTSCSDKDESVETELIVSKEEMIFGKDAGEQKLAVQSNAKWTISSSESWCTLSLASGEPGIKQFIVAVSENQETDPREATLAVVSGGIAEEVKVKQEHSDLLAVTKKEYNVEAVGETITVELRLSGDVAVSVSDFWIQQDISFRATTNQTLKFTVDKNLALAERNGIITLALGDLKETVTIHQLGQDINIPSDKTGMESNALALAAKMNLGWNLGNTLEVPGNEMGWGNPKTTEAMIRLVKDAGINAIRLPCAWDSYLESQETYKIKDLWLARVKEVVDYCVNNEMYAILNIHWDGGWLEENAVPEKQEEVNKKQKALWEQIAVYFRDYDERLLLAGTNEVHSGNSSAKHYDVQMSYNQTFVDAVRSTGGRNTYRNLIIQSFATDIDEASTHMVMSNDPIPNRLMLEVHFYPWQFTLLNEDANSTWGKALYLWGDDYIQYESISGLEGRASKDNNETFIIAQFDKIRTKFVDNGYPAILGEYGVIRRPDLTGKALEKHLESRAYYMEFTTREAKKHGFVPFSWDT
ncbi:MAG: cellulase family glycosylhydrolase, partial [Prevotella sp.]|nr:cellulase family glycosylhydrolase [Prevotella sp.]